MKNSIILFSVFLLTGVSLVQSCESSAEKVKEENENVQEANENLEEAKREYEADMVKFKEDQLVAIAENEKSIQDFKMKIASDKKVTAEYKDEILNLEMKNQMLSQKMDGYQGQSKENWEAFKVEYKHDMESFGKAFKDLTTKNTK
jgi:phosphoenolpyruvate-protein kinase (PTS system EI component)